VIAGNPIRQGAQRLRFDVRPEIKTVFFSRDLYLSLRCAWTRSGWLAACLRT